MKIVAIALLGLATVGTFLIVSSGRSQAAPTVVLSEQQAHDILEHAIRLAEEQVGIAASSNVEASQDHGNAFVLQASTGGTGVLATFGKRDFSWSRIDSFGLRYQYGFTSYKSDAPLLVLFDTVSVPPAYSYCLHHYEWFGHAEVRINYGSSTQTFAAQQVPGQPAGTLMVVVPAQALSGSTSGSIIAWTLGANYADDSDSIVSHDVQ